MATIVVLEHRLQEQSPDRYLLYVLFRHWEDRGHRIIVHRGLEDPPDGDLAILNVDLTVVPDAYLALAARYPRVVNGAVADISKSRFSQHLVGPDSDWPGEVVVKTDRNSGGHPERAMRARARAAGLPCDIPGGPVALVYRIYPRIGEVPETIWSTPGLIVEKFLPEQDSRGFYVRLWTFFGSHERSSRYRAPDPIVKAENFIDREPVPVPDEIRMWRQRLKLDYGKFDYVCRDGQAILLDVNKTPSAPERIAARDFSDLAEGIDAFLR